MNQDLKKFTVKFLLLVLAVVIGLALQLIAGIYIIGPQYTKDYNAAMLDKMARLKSIEGPKIILVGNSEVAFGIVSPMIEEAMNMPVVNLGLHGGLGYAFPEEAARQHVGSGDIVILFNMSFSQGRHLAMHRLVWITVEYYKDMWELIRPEEYISMAKAWPDYWLGSFALWATRQGNKIPRAKAYSRSAFNEYGDVVLKLDDEKSPPYVLFSSGDVTVPSVTDLGIDTLNELNSYIRSKGATMLLAGYAIGAGEFTPPPEKFDALQKELTERLDFEVISNYRDYFIPYEYFFNASAHLDSRGAEIRTAQLVKDLLRWKAKH